MNEIGLNTIRFGSSIAHPFYNFIKSIKISARRIVHYFTLYGCLLLIALRLEHKMGRESVREYALSMHKVDGTS